MNYEAWAEKIGEMRKMAEDNLQLDFADDLEKLLWQEVNSSNPPIGENLKAKYRRLLNEEAKDEG
jgi:hypothetical protein